MTSRYRLQPGDVLKRYKSGLNIIEHYGLYVGDGKVIDNHPERGVSIVILTTFLNGQSIKEIIPFSGYAYQRAQVVAKAYSMLGARYNLTEFNCEHFVWFALKNTKRSPQLSSAGTLFFCSIALWGLIKVA